MILRVECYSGHKGEERPVRFRLDGADHVIEEVLDQWYGLEARFFKVRADDGNYYILRRNESPQAEEWSLESFRRG